MNRLKELRQEKKLSQKELADYLGINEKTISRWENGESTIKSDKAQALADHFGVNTAYLLGYSDSPADNLRDLLFHEIKALKELRVLRIGFENFISENDVLNVIDKYTKLTCREPR
ncbi:helix-turn-helix transcriptional regulator [Streptococcus suis]|nr:helix-turn-helix transcriptional regulator [Streptococcus suis]NQP38572.1 helix-turn-helix transcriptional regulator [Streptococcus suis]